MSEMLVRVLVVDDDPFVREALQASLEMAPETRFEAVLAESPDRCVALEQQGKLDFDVCIIDLGFSPQDEFLVGFRMLLGLSCIRQGGLGIVYTGFPTLANAVRAMQLGAGDFVSKVEKAPHELVAHIESLLAQRAAAEQRRRRIHAFLTRHHDRLLREYGQPAAAVTLAISVDKSGEPLVVASGSSRLEALVEYSKRQRDVSATSGATEPYLHILPALRTA